MEIHNRLRLSSFEDQHNISPNRNTDDMSEPNIWVKEQTFEKIKDNDNVSDLKFLIKEEQKDFVTDLIVDIKKEKINT